MATVFIGTSDFAVTVLERLAASAHRPALVITRPDRPRGRGRRSAPPPAAVVARELGLVLLQPERLNDVVDEIAAAAPTAVCVCAYGALVREPLLSTYEILNVHPSLLPRWRGAAPIERALMAGDARTGVAIIRLTAGLDTGPICAIAPEPIAPDDDYGTLAGRLARLGAELLVRALEAAPRRFEEQSEDGASYAEKIGPEDRLLDPSRTAEELERQVRALHPHIGARAGELRVLAACPADVPAPAGRLTSTPTGELLFGTSGTGPALRLLRVQPPGGRPMEAADYLRGHAV